MVPSSRWHVLVLVAWVSTSPTAGLAQALPTTATDPNVVPAETLRAQIAQDLPGAWRMLELRVEAQVNLGTAVDPEVRSRLRGTVALATPTFSVIQREGAFTFVQPVAPEGATRTVFARSTSVLRAGRWESRFEVETPEALEIPGTPEASVPGRIILSGSDDDRQIRGQWQAQAEARQAEALAEQQRVAALAAQRSAAEAAEAERRRAAEAAEQEARRQQQGADTVAAARWAAAAESALAQAREAEALRTAAEAGRLADARRAAADALEAAARREAEAQAIARNAAAVEGAARSQQEAEQAEARRRIAAAEQEARRQQLEADAVAAARREGAAETARVQARESEALRAAAEAGRIAEARRAAADALEAAARREVEAQAVAQRAAVEARATQLAAMRTQFRAEDRNIRIAAVELAMRSADPAMRALGYEAALTSGDGAVLNLGLRLFFQQTREVPVTTFVPATQTITGEQHRISATRFSAGMNAMVLSIREFDVAAGTLTGTARVDRDVMAIRGTLSRSEMTITLVPPGQNHNFDLVGVGRVMHCTLTLRLSEIQTLDGLLTCQIEPHHGTLPQLLARIALG